MADKDLRSQRELKCLSSRLPTEAVREALAKAGANSVRSDLIIRNCRVTLAQLDASSTFAKASADERLRWTSAMTNLAGFRLTTFGRVRNDTELSPMPPCSDTPVRFFLRHTDTKPVTPKA